MKDKHGTSLIWAFIMVALVIFWVAVCFGPPPFREFFAGLFKSIMNT